jgi:uncharacterized membrane protein
MDPLWQLIAALAGALMGASCGTDGRFTGAIWGAFAGMALIHIMSLRSRVGAAESELQVIRDALAVLRRQAAPAATSTAPKESIVPATRQPDARGPAVAASSQSSASAPALQRWIEGGNWLVRSGVVVLFFGTAFLLRYVAQHTHFPISVRLSLVALCAGGLLGLGWRLRRSRPGYALALQGGAIGIEYLTVFIAEHTYLLLSPAAALALLAALAVILVILAIRQNSQALALLALTGGFLAPVLAPTDFPGTWPMFSYYLGLNCVVLTIAWRKAWRSLNLVAFVFTFGIATIWRTLSYRPENFATAEPFLIALFLLYVAVGVLFTKRQPAAWRDFVDGPLVFAVPAVAFLLQSSLLAHQLPALAWSAVMGGALYGALALALRAHDRERNQTLIDAYLSIAVVFLTIAIPIGLGSRWHAAAWALEGVALVWVGCRQQRALARVFGTVLVALAGFKALPEFEFTQLRWELPLRALVPVAAVSAAAGVAAWLLHRARRVINAYETWLDEWLCAGSVLFWVLGGLGLSPHTVAARYVPEACFIWICLSALAASVLHRRIPLRTIQIMGWTVLPIAFGFALRDAAVLDHPLQEGGAIAWPLAFACFYATSRRLENVTSAIVTHSAQALAAWLLVGLGSWELAYDLSRWIHGSAAWSILACAWLPAILLSLLPRLAPVLRWPVMRYRSTYEAVVASGFAAFLTLWSFFSDGLLSGNVAPLRYIPLLNPIDLTQLLVIWSVAQHVRRQHTDHPHFTRGLPRTGTIVIALGFLWVNAALLRTLHQWFQVPFDPTGLMQSILTQTCLSITWALLAIIAMMIANRGAERSLWNAGAILLAIVILKLFAVDLASSGSIERIISFVVVGVLLLVVGYVSPRPPRSSNP